MSEKTTRAWSALPKETFVGDAITPEDLSFSVAAMATGRPGLPGVFSWKGGKFSVREILEEWKETGDCRHGSGERYVRKHWYRVTTAEGPEMQIYFERQQRSTGGSRWRLYSIREPTADSQQRPTCGGTSCGESTGQPLSP